MAEREALNRTSFKKLTPVAHSEPIPPPERLWSADEWAKICQGHHSRDMGDRWHAFVESHRLFLHRS